jgi:hypothetical protein
LGPDKPNEAQGLRTSAGSVSEKAGAGTLVYCPDSPLPGDLGEHILMLPAKADSQEEIHITVIVIIPGTVRPVVH